MGYPPIPSALRLVAGCGTDSCHWRSAQPFTSWPTLAPGCRISGGKVLSARACKTKSRVTAYLRLAAVTIGKTNTAPAASYRLLSVRIAKAMTTRKIAILIHNAMRFGMVYQDPGAGHYEQKHREGAVKGLHRQAAGLGFKLQVASGVSWESDNLRRHSHRGVCRNQWIPGASRFHASMALPTAAAELS